jgi:hypothetical protein
MTDPAGLVLDSLRDKGIRCIRALPSQRLPVLSEALAAVGVKRMELRRGDAATVFAKWTVFADLYAAYRLGADCCEGAGRTVAAALLEGFADCAVDHVRAGEIFYDPNSDCFRQRVTAEISSYLEKGEDI